MNEELVKIRREKWLQSQHQQSSKTSEHNESSRSDNSGSTDNIKQSKQIRVNKEVIDITSSPESLSKGPKLSIASSTTRKRNDTNKPKSILESIDLTLSSDGEDGNECERNIAVQNESNRSVRNIGTQCQNHKQQSKKKAKISNPHSFNLKQPHSSSSSTSTLSHIQTSTSSFHSASIPHFSVCTYNIWFGPPCPHERMEEISKIISKLNPKPTFIGLQEVTHILLKELRPFFESMGYRIITQDSCISSYGVAIAVLISALDMSSSSCQCHVQIVKSGFHPFQDTIMGRGLLWVHGKIIFPGTTTATARMAADIATIHQPYHVLFTTTHLESFIPKNQYTLPDKHNHDGVKARKNQANEIIQFCTNYSRSNPGNNLKMVMVTGDLNWDDERKKGNGVDQPLLSIMNQVNDNYTSSKSSNSSISFGNICWKDAWKVCHPKQDGYTYDSKFNPMLKGNLRRRFDRCLYFCPTNEEDCSSAGQDYDVVVDAKLVGTSAIDGIEWIKEVPEWKYGKPTGKTTKQIRPVCPSDHFGLVVSFSSSHTPQDSSSPR